jgi:acetyltransferase-like isoleucine patch superfamily enzyme
MSEAWQPPDDAGGAETARSLRSRVKSVWDMEFSNLWWGLLACNVLAKVLPDGRAMRLRAALVRTISLSVGPGTRFYGWPTLQSSPQGTRKLRLKVGAECTVGRRVILEFGELLTIGDRVTLADGAVILTTTHQLGPKEHRAGPLVRTPVTIGNDVWIGTNAIILPGVALGDGARVLADSVVNASVAPGITVSGIPARPLRPAPAVGQ